MKAKESGYLGKVWYVYPQKSCKIASFCIDCWFIFDSQLPKKFCFQLLISQSWSSNVSWKNTELRTNLGADHQFLSFKPFIFFQNLPLPESSINKIESLTIIIEERSWKCMASLLWFLKDTKTYFRASRYPYHMFFWEVRGVYHLGFLTFLLAVQVSHHLLQLQ